jgi:exodeoxyribonuclease V beta subunit
MSETKQDNPRIAKDWTTLPLTPGGRSLIEASAGTGKTWTISVLYLRLLLEPAVEGAAPSTPCQIVVATFTDAAAQELRARIRARLAWAEQLATTAIASGVFAVDSGMASDEIWLRARWNSDEDCARRDRQRLRLALAELDLAPITTLHGLCRRILADYPFESGGAFRPGELVSGDRLLDELAEDLWRRLQQGADEPPELASTQSLSALKNRLRLCLKPDVGLWMPDEEEATRALPVRMADTLEQFAARKGIWLLTGKGNEVKTLKNAIVALAKWLRDRSVVPSETNLKHLADRAEQLDPKQRDILLAEPAMQQIGKILHYLGYAMHKTDIAAWQIWTQQIRKLRDARLSAADMLTFDDLLTRVDAVLRDDSRVLADRLFSDWKVALIDEFQDTDALQYAMLDRIYRDAADTPRGRLIMIGDPKQAIYRFRGGDIETYLRAADSADSKLELGINFRSSRAYVDALDELFERGGGTLSTNIEHRIRVHPVHASDRCDKTPYAAPNGEAAHPLVLHFNSSAPNAAPARERLALVACADQIAAMLNDARYRIGDRQAQPGDIAVLLPTNPQITKLRGLLQDRRVPCVGAGKSSVFETDWARELQIVLYAVEHAHDHGAVRAALATRLGGLDFAQLHELHAAPERWQGQTQRFVECKRQWQRDGVLAVVLDFAQAAMARVPELAERERALTNLRHLGELLQAQSERLHGADQLLAWLAVQRRGDGDDAGEAADERQLRIESDAQRVRLMTLHASKGLEFPIVFLPLMWHHTQSTKDTTPVIHEPLCGQRVIGFGGEAKAQFDREGQDERFRVLYVALTRAIHACHVYVLSPDRPEDAKPNSKPSRDPKRSALDALVDRLLKRESDLAQLRHAHWIEDGWAWPRTMYCPVAAPPQLQFNALPEPAAPVFASTWSFSALTGSHRAVAREDEPADDERSGNDRDVTDDRRVATPVIDVSVVAPDPILAELAMLRGTEFGNALHTIFEQRVIGVPLSAQPESIARALRDAGVRLGALTLATAVTRIAARLDATLAAELLPGLHLGALSASQQRAEMAFHFVLDTVSIQRLREVCARHGDADLVPAGIPAATLRGLMTGKIDLVFTHAGRFHVLDYKSNHLGDGLADYTAGALAAAMDAHRYRFQALLYTVALDRHLRQRLPGYRRDRDLGEAIYLFVRVAGIVPDAGIWRHRFSDALLTAVDGVLGAKSTQEAA